MHKRDFFTKLGEFLRHVRVHSQTRDNVLEANRADIWPKKFDHLYTKIYKNQFKRSENKSANGKMTAGNTALARGLTMVSNITQQNSQFKTLTAVEYKESDMQQ
jgi:hypothetical protein